MRNYRVARFGAGILDATRRSAVESEIREQDVDDLAVAGVRRHDGTRRCRALTSRRGVRDRPNALLIDRTTK
jgi:hypothetical protein